VNYKKEIIQKLKQHIIDFCKLHLNKKYYTVCIKLRNQLINDKIMDINDNNIKIWAATIIFVICYFNNILDKKLSENDINKYFLFNSISISNRAYSIINMYEKIKYDYFVSKADENPIFKFPPLLNENNFPHELMIKYIQKTPEINYIGNYYRKIFYGGNYNEQYNIFCEVIFQLKKCSEQCIFIIFELLKDVLKNDFVIITVPSHSPNCNYNGIKLLTKKIIEYNNSIIDGTDYLIRIKEVNNHDTPQVKRTFEEQINSMKLNENASIRNKNVLLLDDIYTTGKTINAAENIIKFGEPKFIDKLVLGKTYYKN